MKKIIILTISILAMSFAINNNLTHIQTTMTENNKSNVNIVSANTSYLPNPTPLPLVGRTEVIGGTCYDWVNGPDFTWLVNDPANGIHVTWMWSNTEAMADRNMRYNYYDWTTKAWSWIDASNYMNSGIPVFPSAMSSVAGGSDIDPITGNFVISGMNTVGGVLANEIARDQAPGAGLFEYTQGISGYRWPAIAVTHNQAVHVAALDVPSTESLYYARVQPWNTWTSYIKIPPPAPDPTFPNINIAASKTSNKVIIVWEEATPADAQDRAYYRLSTDGGANWGASTQIPFPPSTGMLPSFGVSSLFAMFDNSDNFHIVASVADTGHTMPAEIWHYCPTNTPVYSLIQHYEAETLAAAVGYNAIFACRPTMVQNPSNGYLYVAWEQFDSLNYEPLTSLARADIYVSESPNNGLTWQGKTRITTPNTMSKRFPIAGGIQVTPSTSVPDTLLIMYMNDSIAGAFLQSQHRFCVNPMICHRVAVPIIGIEENNPIPKYYNFALMTPQPNPFKSYANFEYSVPAQGNVSLIIHDVSGRVVKTLVSREQPAGNYSVIWNGNNENNRPINSGVYFCTLQTKEKSITKKVIINR